MVGGTLAVDKGEGCYLYTTDGRKFLDFTSASPSPHWGIATRM